MKLQEVFASDIYDETAGITAQEIQDLPEDFFEEAERFIEKKIEMLRRDMSPGVREALGLQVKFEDAVERGNLVRAYRYYGQIMSVR